MQAHRTTVAQARNAGERGGCAEAHRARADADDLVVLSEQHPEDRAVDALLRPADSLEKFRQTWA